MTERKMALGCLAVLVRFIAVVPSDLSQDIDLIHWSVWKL